MDNQKFNKYYKGTDTFEYYNANPEGAKKKGYVWNRGDCCIRALAKASGMTWVEAFDFLTERARRDFNVVNDGIAFRGWLKESGATWTPCKAEKGKSRMTAEEFAKSHPTGSYIISLANHETACVNGKIYDVWNCGGKCVFGFLDMATFKK